VSYAFDKLLTDFTIEELMTMMKRLTPLMIIGLIFFSVNACAVVHPELKAFPAAADGMERFVIVLPDKDRREDTGFKVVSQASSCLLTV
jgi:hypothetical protein